MLSIRDKEYIKLNTHMGFDELAYKLNVEKSEIKKAWNEMKLGWHSTPRTLIEFRRIEHGKYELLDELLVFIAPATPIVIPKGSITDFASVPAGLRWVIDKDDNAITIAAIVHDVLYLSRWVDRRVADAIFYQLMKYRKAFILKRISAYLAVRLFGWIFWLFYDDEKVKNVQNRISAATLVYWANVINDTKLKAI